MRSVGAAACVLVVVLVGTGARDAGPWLVYQTTVALPANYSCAHLPRQLQRLRLWPGRALATPAGQSANDPVWSPNGRQVAFSSGELFCTNGDGIGQSRAQIWITDSTGKKLRSVTRANPVGGPLDRSPAWSPDGDRIAFARFDIAGGAQGIYAVGVDGHGLRRLSSRTAIALDWSRDGRTIAFIPGERVSFGESAANRVALLDVGSGRVRTLARATDPSDLSWSPDGRLLAVAESQAVAVLDATGRLVRRIRVAPHSRYFVNGVAWSPDGARLAYGFGGAIFTVGRDGSGRQRVVAGATPAWRP